MVRDLYTIAIMSFIKEGNQLPIIYINNTCMLDSTDK